MDNHPGEDPDTESRRPRTRGKSLRLGFMSPKPNSKSSRSNMREIGMQLIEHRLQSLETASRRTKISSMLDRIKILESSSKFVRKECDTLEFDKSESQGQINDSQELGIGTLHSVNIIEGERSNSIKPFTGSPQGNSMITISVAQKTTLKNIKDALKQQHQNDWYINVNKEKLATCFQTRMKKWKLHRRLQKAVRAGYADKPQINKLCRQHAR